MILFVLGIRVALENPTFWCDISVKFWAGNQLQFTIILLAKILKSLNCYVAAFHNTIVLSIHYSRCLVDQFTFVRLQLSLTHNVLAELFSIL